MTEQPTDKIDVPDGFALFCQTCGWPPPDDLTVGVLAAHFETEHGTDAVALDLKPLCTRCGKGMRFEHTWQQRDHFWCDPCKRGRVIRRGNER